MLANLKYIEVSWINKKKKIEYFIPLWVIENNLPHKRNIVVMVWQPLKCNLKELSLKAKKGLKIYSCKNHDSSVEKIFMGPSKRFKLKSPIPKHAGVKLKIEFKKTKQKPIDIMYTPMKYSLRRDFKMS